MNRRLALTAITAALIACAPAHADTRRAERALDGPRPPAVDPGPANVPPFTGTVTIRFLPPSAVRALCPQGIDWHALGCTDMARRTVTMPDEASSGLSTERWLDLLRHEILHAQGLDWHSPR